MRGDDRRDGAGDRGHRDDGHEVDRRRVLDADRPAPRGSRPTAVVSASDTDRHGAGDRGARPRRQRRASTGETRTRIGGVIAHASMVGPRASLVLAGNPKYGLERPPAAPLLSASQRTRPYP